MAHMVIHHILQKVAELFCVTGDTVKSNHMLTWHAGITTKFPGTTGKESEATHTLYTTQKVGGC